MRRRTGDVIPTPRKEREEDRPWQPRTAGRPPAFPGSSMERSRGAAPIPSALAGFEDHFAMPDVPALEHVEAAFDEPLVECAAREARDVLVGVGARHDPSVDPLQDQPEPAR